MKKFENISDLQLTHIDVVQASIESSLEASPTSGKVIGGKLSFAIGLNYGLDIESNKALVRIGIGFQGLEADFTPINARGKFEIDFIFNISNLNEYVQTTDDLREIDSSLSETLLSTAYSTARGIIYTRCQGTVLGNILIPIQSVQDLIVIANINIPHQ